MEYQQLFDGLNAPSARERLENLHAIMEMHRSGLADMPEKTNNVNNHIHTIYSFSPYSPTKAAYLAWKNGLTTAGIMDHDSVAGAREFIEAGRIIGIAATCGCEMRCSMKNTPFAGRRINNPDQDSVVYLALLGIPHQNIAKVEEFLKPYRDQRNIRNRKMVDNLNAILSPYGITIDFDRDVVPLSKSDENGSITERHLLFAVAAKMIERFGKGGALVDFLTGEMKLPLSGKILGFLGDENNPYYQYDLLGALKGNLVERFYIDADAECPDVRDFVALAKEVGAISAYAYLGDVGDSVTGDKKAQKFEDDFLDELVDYLAKLGFNAITYMPTRNTLAQLERVMALCDGHGLFQISGEDINSPRQSFVCEALSRSEFKHLIVSTWALIGHEKRATMNLEDGMFSEKTIAEWPSLSKRVKYFAANGQL